MRGTMLSDDEFDLIDQALHKGGDQAAADTVESVLQDAEATRDELTEDTPVEQKQSYSDDYDEEALLKSLQETDPDDELDFDALTEDFYSEDEAEEENSKQTTSTL